VEEFVIGVMDPATNKDSGGKLDHDDKGVAKQLIQELDVAWVIAIVYAVKIGIWERFAMILD
jgi:hypothetical protein